MGFKLKLSGGQSNTDPALSVGGAISDTEVSVTELHNIFDGIDGPDAAAGQVDYRAVFVQNDSFESLNVKVYLSDNYDSGSQPSGVDSDISIGISTSKNSNALTGSPPSGVAFSQPVDAASARDMGAMNHGEYRVLYIRREVAAGAFVQDEARFEITVKGD